MSTSVYVCVCVREHISRTTRAIFTIFVHIVYYKNKNWLQFLFIVKAAVLKQQISKFYAQIQRIAGSHHIYFSQRPVIKFCCICCIWFSLVLQCDSCLFCCRRWRNNLTLCSLSAHICAERFMPKCA